MCISLDLKTTKFYEIKLATGASYLVGKRASLVNFKTPHLILDAE
jgi:hypothetical protein